MPTPMKRRLAGKGLSGLEDIELWHSCEADIEYLSLGLGTRAPTF